MGRFLFVRWNTIWGAEDGGKTSPYMTRVKLTFTDRLRLHIFHRGDVDPDHHDHPWGFWTFPLTSYVEEVLDPPSPLGIVRPQAKVRLNVVKAGRWHYRPATYAHRVLSRSHRNIASVRPGRIISIVWTEGGDRRWGFHRREPGGSICWIPWKVYVYEGGKDAPCADIPHTERCQAGRDGECIWSECPQIRDGEPHLSGRYCPNAAAWERFYMATTGDPDGRT